MDAGDLELDHVGIAVRDLDTGQAAYERLGFRLTPRSLHHGTVSPGGPVEPWGSGNHCAMLVGGYIEVLGITDPSRYSSARAMLEKHEGAHIVAFGVDSAERAYADLHGRGIAVNGPRALERAAAYGARADETRPARFRNVYTDADAFPEARFIFIEHLTRDVLWQVHLLDHPNGALDLVEVIVCTGDLAASRERISRLLGIQPDERHRGELLYALRRGRLILVDESGLARLAPKVRPPRLPYIAGISVTVGSLNATRELLAGHDVAYHEREDGGIWVGPDLAHGVVLAFLQSPDITHPQDPILKAS